MGQAHDTIPQASGWYAARFAGPDDAMRPGAACYAATQPLLFEGSTGRSIPVTDPSLRGRVGRPFATEARARAVIESPGEAATRHRA
jgi:hypothetical protein